MLDLLSLHKYFLSQHLSEGTTVADFTMGNGHDTLFLSNAVGENGRVYAFDVQQQALDNTKKLLEEENAPNNYTLILDSHANALDHIKEPIKVGVFNLGWLPGAEKTVTTRRESTLEAIKAAMSLLDHDSILLVAVYPGHEEGKLEGEMLDEYFETISRFKFCIAKLKIVNSPTSPFFFTIERK